MRAVVQRVSSGAVYIKRENYQQEIGKGLVVLLGINENDDEKDAAFIAKKVCSLRIFSDENDKMNLSVKEIGGEILIISQFTLYGDARKGNRPNFSAAAKPDKAIPLYEKFISFVKEDIGESKVKSGIFGAMMLVKIFNDGPVTIILDSDLK